ncbi:hypothetical protein CHUAL_013075 [Chamberlinius hualienensis]
MRDPGKSSSYRKATQSHGKCAATELHLPAVPRIKWFTITSAIIYIFEKSKQGLQNIRFDWFPTTVKMFLGYSPEKEMDIEKAFVADGETTFQYDDSLPSLPVPSLDKTLEKYLESVRPFTNEKDYAATKKLVEEFRNGIGPQLQRKLEERAKNMRNWLETWWEDYAYLMTRQPLIPCSNFSGSVRVDPSLSKWNSNQLGQIVKASWVVHYGLQFWNLIRKEKLRPDKPKGQPWSMAQYRRLFSTYRIPGETCDKLRINFKTEKEGPPNSNYIIVLCRGNIFQVQVLDSQNQPLTVPELEKQLRHVQANSSEYGPAVAALTSDERTSWAKNRSYLINLHPDNKKTLEKVENAISFLVLDEFSPANEVEFVEQGVGGDIRNRWADSFNTVVFKNAESIGNADHTPVDGIVGVIYDFYVFLNIHKTKGKWEGSTNLRNIPLPVKLTFVLDDNLKSAIQNAMKTSQELIDKVAVTRFSFPRFGKDFMTTNKMNPDTFLQECIQLSYYRLHNKPAPTYETATTRPFYNGRTETLRSCTTEAINWAKSMLDSTTTSKTRRTLLMKAMEKHEKLMAEGKRNEGCDRHLMGLMILCYEGGQEMPGMFTEPNWLKSGGNGNFILSTSLNGYMPTVGCVTAMCEDGYGVFYSIMPNQINFVISAWKTSQETDIKRMQEALEKSLTEMQQLIVNSSL